jgi:ribonuclease HI
VRKGFKNNKVWLAVDPDGNPLTDKGRVLIKYQLDQDYQYWVKPESIYDLSEKAKSPSASAKGPGPAPQKPRKSPSLKARPDSSLADAPSDGDTGKVIIYTDGASSGNPGPSGVGAVLRFGDKEREISAHIGIATNNIAELTAIEAALNALKRTDIPVRLYTDSSYALGLLTQGWKARKNISLVERIKRRMAQFQDLKLIKVAGHSGIKDNERADQLATEAIAKRLDRA